MAEMVKVRVTGDFVTYQRQDFTLYLDVPPPPNGGTDDEKDAWCALVSVEIEKVKPKGWAISDWDAEIDATGERIEL